MTPAAASLFLYPLSFVPSIPFLSISSSRLFIIGLLSLGSYLSLGNIIHRNSLSGLNPGPNRRCIKLKLHRIPSHPACSQVPFSLHRYISRHHARNPLHRRTQHGYSLQIVIAQACTKRRSGPTDACSRKTEYLQLTALDGVTSTPKRRQHLSHTSDSRRPDPTHPVLWLVL